nr:MAG TPA: hypothetical protein [Herelleviridae sp.]
MEETNKLTLEESIKPLSEGENKKAVEEFSKLACQMVERLYATYNLLRQDPVRELDDHLMVFQSRLGDELTGDIHDRMFKLAFDKRVDFFEANKQFREDVKKGKAIKLGKVEITDTALTNILASNEFKLSISFMDKDKYEERKKIEKEEEEKLENL